MHPDNLVAHRGIPAQFPGNSLQGLDAALKLGIKYLEFDIQISSDGVPVLFHDANLKRETGVNTRVEDLTWNQLQKIKFKRHNGAKSHFLTSLKSAVELLSHYPSSTVFIEVKRAAILKYGIVDVEEAIYKILKPIANKTVPISIHKGFLLHVRQKWKTPIGWICETFKEQNQKQAKILQPDYLFANMDNLSITQLQPPVEWQWAIYETSDPKVAKKWLKSGATLIESNDVATMLGFFGKTDNGKAKNIK
ncbi:MAG: hypothetical protein HQL69_08865 [Magnetococcales bacterium]|nr:hypothetical protein [Magnetococcales bacterium]